MNARLNSRTLLALTFAMLCGFGSAKAKAEEISVHISRAVYQGFFDTVDATFEKDTGIKLTYVEDPTKAADTVAIMQSVVDGKADVAIAPIAYNAWLQLMEKSGKPIKDPQSLTSRVIGRDEIAVITHPNVNVKSLKLEQAVDIFTGKTKNWKEVGGADMPIKLVLPTVAHTKAFMEQQILKGKPFASAIKETEGAPQTIAAVASTEGAFSYTPASQLGTNTSVKRMQMEPFGRPVTMVTRGKPSEKVFKLIKYIGDKKH